MAESGCALLDMPCSVAGVVAAETADSAATASVGNPASLFSAMAIAMASMMMMRMGL